jgi:hypothetical protein
MVMGISFRALRRVSPQCTPKGGPPSCHAALTRTKRRNDEGVRQQRVAEMKGWQA